MIGTGVGFPIGTIGGHQIRLDPVAFGMFGLLIWLNSRDGQFVAAFLVAVFVAVLLHELGHALLIGRFTRQSTFIVIGFAGGYTVNPKVLPPARQLLVSLAGPGAGFLTGAVAWGAALLFVPGHPAYPPWDFYAGMPTWEISLNLFLLGSFFWSAMNLIPALPLDGGQALRAFLILVGMKKPRARRITRWLTLVLALGLGAYGLIVWESLIIGLFAVFSIMAVWDEASREGW